jgi:hypothetical protein
MPQDEGVASPCTSERLTPVGRRLRLPNTVVSVRHVRAPVALLPYTYVLVVDVFSGK